MSMLVVLEGAESRRIELGERITLGRDEGNAICLPDSMVSSCHAEIRRTDEGKYVLRDLGSKHGTRVGGRKVSEAYLSHGDEILIAIFRLRFEDARAELEPAVSSETSAGGKSGDGLGFSTVTMPLENEPRFPPASAFASPVELARDYEKLRAAFDLARALGVEHDLDTLLRRVLDTAFQLLGADRGAILLFEPETLQTTREIARRRSGERERISLSRSVLREVTERKAGILTADAPRDARFERSRSVRVEGMRSVMCVPLLYRDEILGVMHLDSLIAANVFHQKDLELFTTIANQAALALKNATLVRQMRKVGEWQRLERVMARLPEGVLVLDSELRVVLSNPRGKTLLALLSDAGPGDVLSSVGGVEVSDLVVSGGEEGVAIEVAGPPARVLTAAAAAVDPRPESHSDIVLVLRDVTLEREREQRSARQERLTLLGQLAGGIAHDFNNILSVVLNNADFVASGIGDGRLREDVERIRRAAQRGGALTRQLLSFSRRELVRPQVIDLHRLVHDMTRMLGRTLGAHIGLETRLGEDVPWVQSDPARLEHVLLNLVVNARDAMPSGGTVTIETEALDLDEIEARRAYDVKPGRYAMIAISDTGLGMTPEVARRAFDPFFTTKERGKGTGLGLASVYGVITEAGGGVRVDSEAGVGTTFRLVLPAAEEEPTVDQIAQSMAEGNRARGTVLLVEDDEDVRHTVERMLAEAGYRVLAAESGSAGVELAEEHLEEIDLLLTDLVLPTMSGRQLADNLRRLVPELAVLYMSGYVDDAVERHRLLGDEQVVLAKPFTRDDLLARVLDALHQK